jgi:hypothetical protein
MLLIAVRDCSTVWGDFCLRHLCLRWQQIGGYMPGVECTRSADLDHAHKTDVRPKNTDRQADRQTDRQMYTDGYTD